MSNVFGSARKNILTCILALMVLAPFGSADAASSKVRYRFQGGSDGVLPWSALIADGAGNMYGTTVYGGQTGCYGLQGCGTVFKLAPDGTETVLHAFSFSDGALPNGALLADRAGNLFGTTFIDGAGVVGTVFKLAPDGTFTVLHAFQRGSDGAYPSGALIADGAGNLFGTTQQGGGSQYCSLGCGTVFKLAPDGTETVLYAFRAGSDGWAPESDLIADASGNLYGTTTSGGGGDCDFGCGTVFKVAPDGNETVLHAFQDGSDGANPDDALIADAAGNLYGTTAAGGGGSCAGFTGGGTVFKIAPDGTESVLYAFQGGNDGCGPLAGLIADKAGNFYGTTYYGGDSGLHGSGCGTVFQLAPDGTETVVYAFKKFTKFNRCMNGGLPTSTLLKGHNGLLCGTATSGGSSTDDGIVFSVHR